MQRTDIRGCVYSQSDMIFIEDIMDNKTNNEYINIIMTYDDYTDEYIEIYDKNNIPNNINKMYNFLKENSFLKEKNETGLYELIGPNFKKIDNRQVSLMCFEEFPTNKDVDMYQSSSKLKEIYDIIINNIAENI